MVKSIPLLNLYKSLLNPRELYESEKNEDSPQEYLHFCVISDSDHEVSLNLAVKILKKLQDILYKLKFI